MFIEKLNILLQDRKLTRSKFLSDLNMGKNQFKYWETKGTPNRATISAIASYFNVPVSFFDDDTEEENTAGKPDAVFDYQNVRLVPVYESVSAGFGALARNDVITRVPCTFRTDNEATETIGIKVHGDSMYPKIEDGDIVIVHKQTSIDSGTLGVVIVDGDEGYVKRIEYGDDWICLHSINPMYPVMKFKNEDVLRVQVVGRVTKIIKDV